MEKFLSQLPSLLLTLIFGLVGVGIGWGYFKSEIKNLKESTIKFDDKLDKTGNKLDALIFTAALKIDCMKFREDCQEKMAINQTEIKGAIENNRTIVLEKFDEIKEFIGYVKAKIENYNGK